MYSGTTEKEVKRTLTRREFLKVAGTGSAGAALLNTPNVWFGCMWNATHGKGYALEGERLEAFRSTLADAQARRAA